MKIGVLAVCVGRPHPLGTLDGKTVISGFVKRIVTGDRIRIGATNLAGDEQADLRVHGGADKAVYAYPSEHWTWWEREHGLPCMPATFGENLTLAGADETQVAIGDRFRWGSAVLEVSQPRAPCFKLAMHTRRAEAPQLMTISGRCGWYFRVCDEGEAPTDGSGLERIHAEPGPTVGECFAAALHPRTGRDALLRVAAAAKLSAAWRESVTRRLGQVG